MRNTSSTEDGTPPGWAICYEDEEIRETACSCLLGLYVCVSRCIKIDQQEPTTPQKCKIPLV